MIDYEKQCWFCLKYTMEPVSTYFQCTKCGATWNSQPRLGPYMGVVVESLGEGMGTFGRPKLMRGKVKGGPPLPPLLRPSDKGYGKDH